MVVQSRGEQRRPVLALRSGGSDRLPGRALGCCHLVGRQGPDLTEQRAAGGLQFCPQGPLGVPMSGPLRLRSLTEVGDRSPALPPCGSRPLRAHLPLIIRCHLCPRCCGLSRNPTSLRCGQRRAPFSRVSPVQRASTNRRAVSTAYRCSGDGCWRTTGTARSRARWALRRAFSELATPSLSRPRAAGPSANQVAASRVQLVRDPHQWRSPSGALLRLHTWQPHVLRALQAQRSDLRFLLVGTQGTHESAVPRSGQLLERQGDACLTCPHGLKGHHDSSSESRRTTTPLRQRLP